jgi:hypothetical protein
VRRASDRGTAGKSTKGGARLSVECTRSGHMRRRGVLLGGNDGRVAEELQRRAIAQGLMRAHGVVDAFPRPGLAVEGGHGPRQVGHFVELFGVRALGALDGAVELRTLGG